MPMYIVNNNTYYKWIHNRDYSSGGIFQREYKLYKDTILISVGHGINSMESYYYDQESNKIYLWYYNCKVFDLNTDSLIQFLEKVYNGTVMTDSKLYYSKNTSLYIQYLKANKTTDSIDICTIFNKPDYEIFKVVKLSNTKSVFLGFGDYDGGEISDEHYYIYDEISKKIGLSENNDILKTIFDPNSLNTKFYDLSGKYVFIGEYIIDSSYNVFSKIKDFNTDIYGIVISNREIKQLLLKSTLDLQENAKDKTEVLIPFIPNPFREKAMYEIYENITLKAEDLRRFDAFDLRILRNMIFAKHNYAFKDKFLQAYFNLYDFYRVSNNKVRLTDVNHLLTPTDKKNLELIQQIIKTKEKS
jgi:hypothetical protein